MKNKQQENMKHNICMVCDFFYPNVGGVENHIYNLAQCLLARGHKVVVMTHAYGDRTGVRYMTNGLKVYYLPLLPIYNQCILPTLFATLPLVRNILVREEITVVHGHSAFSDLAHETMIHAGNMGIRTVFTDHSLFGFADASAIITNKLLELCLLDCNRVICVSHTSKENTVLRARVRADLVSVIPNAVDCNTFVPDYDRFKRGRRGRKEIVVVVMSRLVYRKGVDLLAGMIPIVCERYPNLRFLIAGDGPKRILLEEVRENYNLLDRVKMIGMVPQDKARDVLVSGDIFLNPALTEAFCMAIVEAAACGLQVVSTRVGGIPEVLPPDMIWLAEEPSVKSLVEALGKVVEARNEGKVLDPATAHARIAKMYRWDDVARRTEKVYDAVAKDEEKPAQFSNRIKKCLDSSRVWGKVIALLIALDYIILCIIEYIYPKRLVDRAPKIPFRPELLHKQETVKNK